MNTFFKVGIGLIGLSLTPGIYADEAPVTTTEQFNSGYQEIYEKLSDKSLSREDRLSIYDDFQSLVYRYIEPMNQYWDKRSTFDNRHIFYASRLYEADRMDFHTANRSMTTTDYDPMALETSRSRAILGYAPIAYDGKPTLVCNLLPVQNGALFEISELSAARIATSIPSEISKNIECDNHVGKNYWSSRAAQEFDMKYY